MRTFIRALAALAACAAGLAAAAPPAISDAWLRATPPGAKTGAAYLTVSGDAADTLLAASSPAARSVELHAHVTENDLSRMQRLAEVPVPTDATVRFEPGGLHLMLIDIAAPLVAGQRVTLTLRFANAGDIEITAPVIDARASAPHGAH